MQTRASLIDFRMQHAHDHILMKTESPTLAVLAVRCQQFAENHASDSALNGEGLTLYTEWQGLVARASTSLSIQERREVDANAASVFNRMRRFMAYHASQVTS